MHPRERRRDARHRASEALVDCEHFFDGYKANPAYALACAKAALDAGARWVVLCDTNGGTQPSEVRDIVRAVIAAGIPGEQLGIHAHDDTGQAVANSLAAVEAGVRQVQGTLNGIGERCGNANLVTIIPTLALKPGSRAALRDRHHDARRWKASRVCRASSTRLLNRAPDAQAPYVGASAFATKAGIHASAIAKEPQTYEHVPPESVGNRRRVMVSDQGGKSNFIAELEAARHRGAQGRSESRHADLDRQGARSRRAMPTRRRRRASNFLPGRIARLGAGILPGRELPLHGRAPLQRQRQDRHRVGSRGEGGGRRREMPVGCRRRTARSTRSTSALRKDLGKYQGEIADLELTDYKVRILNGGTEAVTRVLIESSDASGERWTTVGVSDNIIDASFQALMDSIGSS